MLHNLAHDSNESNFPKFIAGEKVSVGYEHLKGNDTILQDITWNGIVCTVSQDRIYPGNTHGQRRLPNSIFVQPFNNVSVGEHYSQGHPMTITDETVEITGCDGSISGLRTIVRRGFNAFDVY